MGVKNGKCEECEAPVVIVEETLYVYRGAHMNPINNRKCRGKLTRPAYEGDTKWIAICHICTGREAAFRLDEIKTVQRPACPKGHF